MRKVFFVLGLIMPLVMGSCGKDDDNGKSLTVSPSSVTLYSGDTQQLVADGEVDLWETEDRFVVKVDEMGLVTANHVGSANVTASNSDGKSQCQVTVKPKYSFKYEPFLKFGATMEEVKKAVSYEIYQEKAGEVTFAQKNPSVLWTYYFNESGKYYMVLFMCELLTTPATLSDYLLERYAPLKSDEDNGTTSFSMVDSYDANTLNTMVDYSISKKYTTVIWISNEYNNKSSSKKSLEYLAKSFVLD
ncbi:MAG: Ig-like domain-containing protein [Bacteroidales bacterium]|nr:Ig-like domain-containing protein [Bacteroidales bacterium]